MLCHFGKGCSELAELAHYCIGILNFLVSYVKVKDFDMFWKKYLDHIKNYKYPYPLKKWKIVLEIIIFIQI